MTKMCPFTKEDCTTDCRLCTKSGDCVLATGADATEGVIQKLDEIKTVLNEIVRKLS